MMIKTYNQSGQHTGNLDDGCHDFTEWWYKAEIFDNTAYLYKYEDEDDFSVVLKATDGENLIKTCEKLCTVVDLLWNKRKFNLND